MKKVFLREDLVSEKNNLDYCKNYDFFPLTFDVFESLDSSEFQNIVTLSSQAFTSV